MKISFLGPRLKVKRAYKHIDELETWLRDLVQSNIDSTRAHKDANPGSESDTLVISRPSGYSVEVGLIVGDAIHNLRAALDLVASAIIIAGNGDASKVYFPLGDTRQTLVGSAHYRLIESVAPDLATIIADIIKPYKTGGNPNFWALNRLDRMDKHRVLIPTIANACQHIVAIGPKQEDDPPAARPGAIYMICGTTTQESRAPRVGSAAYLHNQRSGYGTIEIGFGEGEAFENEPIIPTLRQLAQLVSGVIDSLESHCQRGEGGDIC